MALAADGTVYTWGYNWYGNLGNGTYTDSHVPGVSTGLSGAVAIGAGYWDTYAIKTDGSVWAAGWNNTGQFGMEPGGHPTPVQMGTVANVTAIVGGFDFSIVLESDQTVWGAGNNFWGELGNGVYGGTSTPTVLSTLPAATALASGYRHAFAIAADGTLLGWGQNGWGQLGDGSQNDQFAPTAVPGLTNIVAVATGTGHTVAVDNAGAVYTWGVNYWGQLGYGATGGFSSTPIQIAGPGHTWKLPAPSLSVGTGTYSSDVNVSISSPVAGVELHYTLNGADPTQSDPSVANGGTVTIDRTKTLKARAWKTGWTTSPVSTATYTMQVADVTIAPASGLYPAPLTVAMSTSTPSATIYYTTDGSTPTAGSALYGGSLIVATATTVKALAMRTGWTSSGVSSAAYEMSAGTLGVPVITPASGSFTSSVTVSISAAAGTIHYTLDNSTPSEASPVYTAPFAVTASTTVKARAFQAQWLPSDTAFAPLEIVVADPTITPGSGTYAPDQTITAVSATPAADVHYTLDGTEPTTGSPVIAASAHLTVGTYTLKVRAFKAGCTPSAIVSATFATTGAFTTPAIAASWSTSLALRSDGQVWAWGDNGYYTLGDGTWNSRNTPGLVPGLTGVRQLLAGVAHIMALMPDGSLVVWGDNFDGRLGLGNNSPQLRPVTVPGLTNVAGADGGSQHTVVLLNDGTVVSSGLNNYGQLGDGTNTGRNTFAPVPGLTNVTAIHAGPYSSLALRGDGTVWAWGFNQYGQLGEGTNGNRSTPTQVTGLSNVRTLDGGYLSSAAITSDGTLWTWGDNSYGQLGDAVPSRNVPGAVPGLTYVSQVAVGDYHVVALRSDGTVWTFGRNLEGELGDGTTTGRTTPMQVAGLTDIVQIAAGQFHSMALAADGTVYVWGRNYAGTIGDGTWWNNALTPFAITLGSLSSRPSAPVIAPGSGMFTTAQTVTITTASAPAGTTIHYTLDGTDPTLQSPLYTGALAIATRSVITARAFRSGLSPSRATTATLIFDYGTLATPTASPAGGNFQASVNVTISGPASATIRYTTDGNDPTETSPVYSAPLTFSNTTTLKARAYRPDWTPSAVLTEAYVNPCVFTVAPGAITAGSHASGGVLTVTAGDPGCAWNATTNVPWITLGAAGGSGSGVVPYVIAANADGTARSGALTIAGQTIVVSQGAAACTFSLTPGGIAATANATVGTIGVTPSDASCTWSTSSDAAWATFTVDPQTSAYKRAVLADHPVGYWRLDAAPSATTVADATTGGHDGAVTGTVTFGAAGAIADGATAATFDGATSTIAIPHDAAFVLPALSWEAWINVPQVADHQRRILGKGSANETFGLWMNANATQPTIVWTSVGGGHQSATLSTNVIAAGWVHIAFAYDGLTWHAYVNGVEDQTGALVDTLVSNSQSLLLGREDATPATAWYDGQLQDVAVYPYALSAAQIANHYALRTAVWSGTGTLEYTIAENQTGTARSATLTIAGVPVPVQQGNTGDLIITGYVTPSPNSGGWNNTNVTVSFACAGPGTVTCPPPIPVTTEGAQEITGTASNDLGQSATATVTVQVDMMPPAMSITSPANNAVVAPAVISVTGIVQDTSGAAVTCDGAPATVARSVFTCQETIPSGGKTIVIVAMDQASHSRTVSLVLKTSDALTTEPVSLRLTPQNVTMVVGEFRKFSLRDDLGRTPLDAVWTVDHEEVANFVPTSPTYLQALTAGEVTVTATWRGLTATTHVTVLAAAPTAVGTVMWVAPTLIGEVQQIVQTTAPDGSPRSYVTEGDATDYVGSDMIRGFDGEGGEVWGTSANGKVTQLSATVEGGAVAAITNTSTGTHVIRAYDPGGAPTDLPDLDLRGTFAVDPLGVVYHVTTTGELVGYDLRTGASQRVALPKSTLRNCTGGTYSAPQGCTSSLYFESAGTPTILWSGRVVVPVITGMTTYINDVPQRSNDRFTISAFFLNTDATTTVIPVWGWSREASFAPFKAIPNGQGGVLVAWTSFGVRYNDFEAQVATVRADNTISGPAGIGNAWGDLALGENDSIIAVTQVGPGQWTRRMITYLTPDSGIASWGFLNNQEVSGAFAVQGGGFVLNYADGSMSGPGPGYADMHLKHAQYSPATNTWLGGAVGPANYVSLLSPTFVLASNDWPSWLGGLMAANIPPPRGLTTGELRKLAEKVGIGAKTTNPYAFNVAVGRAFENFCLATQDMGPPNRVKLFSPLRGVLTYEISGVTIANVVPDAINVLSINGLPLFEGGAILDVKAVNGALAPWYPNYSSLNPKFQIAGFIDVASRSLAGLAGFVPYLEFDTTEDTTVPAATLLLANNLNVAVWQAKVLQYAGGVLQVPSPTLLNPNVFVLANATHPERPRQIAAPPPAGRPRTLLPPLWPVGIPDDPDDLPIVDPFDIIPQP